MFHWCEPWSFFFCQLRLLQVRFQESQQMLWLNIQPCLAENMRLKIWVTLLGEKSVWHIVCDKGSGKPEVFPWFWVGCGYSVGPGKNRKNRYLWAKTLRLNIFRKNRCFKCIYNIQLSQAFNSTWISFRAKYWIIGRLLHPYIEPSFINHSVIDSPFRRP
jgi:hypothetical protein